MKGITREEGESDIQYLLREVECLNDNIGDLSYKLMQAHDKIDALETFTNNCIDILSKSQDKTNKEFLKLLKFLQEYSSVNANI